MSLPIIVYVIKPGQVAKSVSVPYDSTVEDVLRAVGITNVRSDEEVRLDGQVVSLNAKISAGQTVSIHKITVLPKAAGGN